MTDHPTGDEARVDQALRSLQLAVRTAVVPPQPAVIRRRAERRRVHRAVAGLATAAAVVAAVTGTAAVLPAHRATKPPPAPASPSPEPSASPVPLRAAALKPADMGAGYSVEGEVPWSPFPGPTVPGESCGAWRPSEPGASSHVRGGYSVSFKAPRGHYDGQDIWRFDAQWAVVAMRETRGRLRLCPRVEAPGDPGVVTMSQWTLIDSDFAGADSLAVRHDAAANGVVRNVDFFVVVRQGDVVGSLWLSDQRWTAPRLREVGRAMAARLLVATR